MGDFIDELINNYKFADLKFSPNVYFHNKHRD